MKKYIAPETTIIELERSEAVETVIWNSDKTAWWDGHEWIPN